MTQQFWIAIVLGAVFGVILGAGFAAARFLRDCDLLKDG
jgi:hypothetical protein